MSRPRQVKGTPVELLAVFLWEPIFSYLDLKSVFKLFAVHPHFRSQVVPEKTCQLLLRKRWYLDMAVALTWSNSPSKLHDKTVAKAPHFWRDCHQSKELCVDLEDAFCVIETIIENENKKNKGALPFYFIVFLPPGEIGTPLNDSLQCRNDINGDQTWIEIVGEALITTDLDMIPFKSLALICVDYRCRYCIVNFKSTLL
eukprot:TRINITY_DN535_c0_g1_i7.p1 TRINITY_DN535_c0_g1~~TRINITY_DN535_c0_g1_i7.p1  ORF type:complete len:200 (+),score=15.80 TRINITY_DN535_c0_g1_i7:8-607(+)